MTAMILALRLLSVIGSGMVGWHGAALVVLHQKRRKRAAERQRLLRFLLVHEEALRHPLFGNEEAHP